MESMSKMNRRWPQSPGRGLSPSRLPCCNRVEAHNARSSAFICVQLPGQPHVRRANHLPRHPRQWGELGGGRSLHQPVLGVSPLFCGRVGPELPCSGGRGRRGRRGSVLVIVLVALLCWNYNNAWVRKALPCFSQDPDRPGVANVGSHMDKYLEERPYLEGKRWRRLTWTPTPPLTGFLGGGLTVIGCALPISSTPPTRS